MCEMFVVAEDTQGLYSCRFHVQIVLSHYKASNQANTRQHRNSVTDIVTSE